MCCAMRRNYATLSEANVAESMSQLNWGILIQRCLQEAVEVAYEQGKKAGQQNGGGHA